MQGALVQRVYRGTRSIAPPGMDVTSRYFRWLACKPFTVVRPAFTFSYHVSGDATPKLTPTEALRIDCMQAGGDERSDGRDHRYIDDLLA